MVTYLSWRWIFWINVPIGAFGVTLAFRVLRDSGRRTKHHLDLVGMGSPRPRALRHPVGHHPQGPRGMAPIDASLLLVPGYVVGSAVGPLAGRVADRFGPVLPATAGLSLQVVALLVYSRLSIGTGLWVVVVASVLNGIGASGFFPANTAALMRAVKPQVFGVASGMLRTFANIGMVFSFSMAILVASRSISRGWHLSYSWGRPR